MQNQTTKNDKHILNAPSTAVKTASFGPVSNPHFIEYDTRTPNRLANGQCLYTGGYLIIISVTPLIPIHLFLMPALTEGRSRFKRHSKLCTVILYQKKTAKNKTNKNSNKKLTHFHLLKIISYDSNSYSFKKNYRDSITTFYQCHSTLRKNIFLSFGSFLCRSDQP